MSTDDRSSSRRTGATLDLGVAALRDRLASTLARHEREELPPLPGRTNHLHAGVLVPLLPSAGDLSVVITERTAHLTNHPGELCFPGGRPDADDDGLVATALREAREEVGVVAAEVLGALSSVPLLTSDHRLHPFVALLPQDATPTIASPDEVARVHLLSVEALLGVPAHHGIAWTYQNRPWIMPVFEVGDRFVFGGTAGVLYELLGVLATALGRPLPPLVTGRYAWADVLPPTT